MSTPHHRDPETGEVVVNGRIGAVRAWARWFQPILVTVTATLVSAVAVASGAQLWQHYDQHHHQEDLNAKFIEFMEQGQRFSSSAEYPGIDDVSDLISFGRLEVAEQIQENAPPQWLRDRIDALEETVKENQKDIKELLRRSN